jgi:predicted MPP superfamily phosphohydrolase
MARNLWSTDLHLNRFFAGSRKKYIEKVWSQADNFIVTGDISNYNNLVRDLQALAREDKKVYFVCGNHECSGSGIQMMKNALKDLPSNLVYLTTSQPIELSPTTCLIGDDGWYDSRYCEPLSNAVFWFDWSLINEFANKSATERIFICREMAWESTQRIVKKLLSVINSYSQIIIATHFPSVKQKYRFDFTDKFWIPYNTNKYLGEMLEIIAENHPKVNIKVLCGHTHQKEYIKITDNLECWIGASRELIPLEI